MSVPCLRALLATFLLAALPRTVDAQPPSAARGMHDSISVGTLSFPGAVRVSIDDLRRTLFTRGSTCRLPFLVPVCKITASQLFTDRRRTTSRALGEDITKLRVYYWQRGFREAQVDTLLTPRSRGVDIAFRIVEGRPTRIGSMTITQRATVLTARDLADLVVLREGDPLNLIALDTTLARLRAAVWNKGFGDARIDTVVPPPDSSGVVPVRIDIDPRWITRVGRVEFDGNRYLDDATLRRGILLQPGALYTRDAVLESERRLFESPAIARAVVVTPAAGDSIKQITMAITEVPAHHAEVTVGANTIEFGQAAVELRHNDLGGGRWLRLRAAAANLLAGSLDGTFPFRRAVPTDATFDGAPFLRPTYQASATVTQPWIGDARTSASISAFAGRRSLVGVAIDDNAGVSLGVVRRLAPRIPVGLTYRLESTRVSATAVYFCAGYGICDGPTAAALGVRQRLAPVGVSAWIDHSDDLEVPTTGYTAVLDAEHASRATGSTFTHSRLTSDASYYRTIGVHPRDESLSPKVLAVHVRGGWVRPVFNSASPLNDGTPGGLLHPRVRFYAGGMQSVRGFAENELGPRVLQVRRASLTTAGCTETSIASGACDPSAVPNDQFFARPVGGSSVIEGSIEMRVPLLKQLGAVAFLDGAYVGTAGV
ncbi:MAG: BamA/TamA family outer membrane protein, partial [Gemmatimonadaceae bacterium]|nr:BamA/TamA family outer membrane protein [Gemmatimonadaceae bacterium]